MAAPDEPEAAFDQTWLEHTEENNRDETHRLVQELKGYKNNLVKESIRVRYPYSQGLTTPICVTQAGL